MYCTVQYVDVVLLQGREIIECMMTLVEYAIYSICKTSQFKMIQFRTHAFFQGCHDVNYLPQDPLLHGLLS